MIHDAESDFVLRKQPHGRYPSMPTLIQSVDRALRILEAMAAEERPLGLGEIGARVNLHVSTVHRLLATLRARRFVEQDESTGRYRIGTMALKVGGSFLSGIDLRESLRPLLEILAAKSAETANLVILQGLEAVYVDHVIGTKVAKLFTQVGQRVPLHCTAVGKALLAFAPPQERVALSSRMTLTRFTKKTFVTRKALAEELMAVRAAGYAVDREEHEDGVACLAAPVFDSSGRVAAAIGVSGPSGRVLTLVGVLAKTVQTCAAQASRSLGYSSGIVPGETRAQRLASPPVFRRRMKPAIVPRVRS
jgi:DNA-binding IclR family transcriptional regulator